MKFRVTMKDPDTLYDAIGEAVKAEVAKIEGLSPEDREDVLENRCASTRELCSQWFEYGEYLTVEIDTDAGTATVCQK